MLMIETLTTVACMYGIAMLSVALGFLASYGIYLLSSRNDS